MVYKIIKAWKKLKKAQKSYFISFNILLIGFYLFTILGSYYIITKAPCLEAMKIGFLVWLGGMIFFAAILIAKPVNVIAFETLGKRRR